MGAETEYALAVVDRAGRRGDPESAARDLFELAKAHFPHLTSSDGQGVFLGNGGKFYIDVGCHPEYATPECSSPWELVRYTAAGDRIMARLVSAMQRRKRSATVLAFRGNTGYGSQPQTWACHESYLCRRHPTEYTEQILPFLVSRMVFAGSGGFDPFSPGIAFTLSPRSHFLTTVSGTETMHSRPIVNLRCEPLASGGWNRLHLICADAVGSHAATWLRAGTTALAIALIDARLQPARDMQLQDPVAALRTFAADTTMTATVPTTRGEQITAIGIQRRYLDLVRANIGAEWLPGWTPAVIEGWDRTLRLLGQDLESLASVYDWVIKRTVYGEFCAQRGLAWDSLRHWTHLVTRIQEACRKARAPFPAPLTLEAIRDSVPCREEVASLAGFMEENGLRWPDLSRFLSLRTDLLELDTRFLQLDGIFHNLDRDGVLHHTVLPDQAAIEEAVVSAPARGRAAVRGRYVQEFAGSRDHQCSWIQMTNGRTKQTSSLADPFAESAEWSDCAGDKPSQQTSALNVRNAALNSYLAEDHETAASLLRQLLAAGFERPSTYCHLARVALATDAIAEAEEYVRRAWECRDEGPSYIPPRILWLEIALAMLRIPSGRPLPLLLGALRTALRDTHSYDWTVAPVLDHLQDRLPEQDHALLAALAAAINDHNRIPALDAFPLWRAAAVE